MSLSPHIAYLHVIADTCPNALGTYLLCHQLASDDTLQLTLTDAALEDAYTTKTLTINNLRKLAHAGLLEYHHKPPRIHVTLASPPDDL